MTSSKCSCHKYMPYRVCFKNEGDPGWHIEEAENYDVATELYNTYKYGYGYDEVWIEEK